MIKQKSSKIVYKNPWMSVREDEVEFANGTSGIYGVVEKPDFVLIIPYDGQHFYLVQQYRYPIQRNSWEFPQGSYENDPHADPLEVARGELKEETGLTAGSIEKIGYLYEANGYATQGVHIYLATELKEGTQDLESSEADMKVAKLSLQKFEEKVLNGEMTDGPTLSAYGLLKVKKII
jgi:ADP-ribose pyrophosphatase